MKKENNKGITLIALVITIIVMLILVAVSVALAVKGDLFGNAQEGTEKMSIEAEKEQLTEYVYGQYRENADKKVEVNLEEVKTILNSDKDKFKGDAKIEGDKLTVTGNSGVVYTVYKNGVIESEKEHDDSEKPTLILVQRKNEKYPNKVFIQIEGIGNWYTEEEIKQCYIDFWEEDYEEEFADFYAAMCRFNNSENGTNCKTRQDLIEANDLPSDASDLEILSKLDGIDYISWEQVALVWGTNFEYRNSNVSVQLPDNSTKNFEKIKYYSYPKDLEEAMEESCNTYEGSDDCTIAIIGEELGTYKIILKNEEFNLEASGTITINSYNAGEELKLTTEK